jgi:hypothetical protein
MRIALAAVGFLVMPIAVAAEKLETTHLFGFTLGTDVNNVGEVEGELETMGRFAKRDGAYTALSPTLGIKFIPFQNFSIEPGVGVAHHNISSVPGLDDRKRWAFDSLSLELRYRVLDREYAPFGLTFGFDPHWGQIDDISGASVDRYGSDFLVAVDRELVANRIFAAFNLIYQPEATRLQITGAWQHQSSFGISGALTVQVQPGVLIGAEVRYLRSFDFSSARPFTQNSTSISGWQRHGACRLPATRRVSRDHLILLISNGAKRYFVLAIISDTMIILRGMCEFAASRLASGQGRITPVRGFAATPRPTPSPLPSRH